MKTISAAQMEGHISELLDEVERGEEVVVTRQGKAIARISALLKKQSGIPFDALRSFRQSTKKATIPSRDLLRKIRDEG